jgi:glutamate-1-semialdehyde 2,1-aminomutase
LLEQQGFYEELEKKTNLITAPVMECIQKHQLPCCLQKQGSMFTLFFGKKEVKNMDDARQLNSEAYKSFFYEMFIQGVYLPPLQMEACFVSSAHTDEHLSHTANLIVEFLTKYNF